MRGTIARSFAMRRRALTTLPDTARYASASSTFGYPITPPAGFLTFMGTTKLLLGHTDRATEILERTVERYPQSADARDAFGRAPEGRTRVESETGTDPAPSLVERGDSLFVRGRFDGAIDLYERAGGCGSESGETPALRIA